VTHAEAGTRVLAIGVDAAEASLVRRFLAEGTMPVLASLLKRGRWCHVESSASIGSGNVWPSFLTGTPPSAHGVYGEWLWRPEAMGIGRASPGTLTPFWAHLARSGKSVGVLDVPFAPHVGLEKGFEVSEWGAHDVLEGRTRASPPAAAELLSQVPPHPFTVHLPDIASAGDRGGLAAAAEASREGIRARGALAERLLSRFRPDLGVIVFPETHYACHLLWHTVAPEDPMFGGTELAEPIPGPTVADLYRAVDQEIQRLTSMVGPDCSVVVFAPYGMRPGWGVPTLLRSLLRADQLAHRPMQRDRSWRERSTAALGFAKRHSPPLARRIYRSRTPRSLRRNLARPTMLELHDWSRTRAFALPTDQNGWVRVNLAGRERLGVVPEADYVGLCDALETRLQSLATIDGRPVVADVLRPARSIGEARISPLPDLVVHWDLAAYDDPPHLGDGIEATPPTGRRRTGEHATEGFCVATGAMAELLPDSVPIEALPERLAAVL
jgi:predicted AlkP superfamily phosphohydrolase/phosphomutase